MRKQDDLVSSDLRSKSVINKLKDNEELSDKAELNSEKKIIKVSRNEISVQMLGTKLSNNFTFSGITE